METRFGGEIHHFYGLNSSDLRGMGKRSVEWDLNEWKWDGDLFVASSLNPIPSDCRSRQIFPHESGIPISGNTSNSSSSCSDEVNPGIEKGKRELEKRRAILIEDEDSNDQAGTLTLNLGGNEYPATERKKTKLIGVTSNRAVCQVEDCPADLSNAKDYHRRHKVCEMHSKASKALVGNVMQRFCQQCSRFHLLQEFDEGKRSCRRRLAGHNKRRRKQQADSVVNVSSLNGDQASGYLLMTLLRILSNMHSNGADPSKDQDLLSHILRSLSNQSGFHQGGNITGLMQESRDSLNGGSSQGNPKTISPSHPNISQSPLNQHLAVPSPETPNKGARVVGQQSISSPKIGSNDGGRIKLHNFDLNDVYIDSDDNVEDLERSPVSQDFPSWIQQQDSHQSSPPQASANSDSASAHSPSSSSGDTQSRTDRIVIKLFGKEPNDFPLVLRAQILDWLSQSPTDIESYIRPGCIILTIYLRLAESAWEELCCNLSSSLTRLLSISDNGFWSTGWVYIRVQHQIAFLYNGLVVLDTGLPLNSRAISKISSVKPIAITASEAAQFSVQGFNLFRPTARLLCALDGKYLIQEPTHELVDDIDSLKNDDQLQSLNLSCSIPTLSGRGFIEVEDHGLCSSFFPFIVAEKEVCSEIRMLERAMDWSENEEEDDDEQEGTGKRDAKNQALDFIHEIGWLLHRCHLKSRLGNLDPNSEAFSFKRFRWIMEFSVDRDWCAVVKKLLDIFLISGIVGVGEHPSLMDALSEMDLLHRAVRRNCRPLVELLLRYVPEKVSEEFVSLYDTGDNSFLFRPDAAGPAGLTPLHIAAGRDGSEDVLDALTDDPGMVGIEAWKKARDGTGFTPEDYARLRGHFIYIHLVQKKINRKPLDGHVALDIPASLPNSDEHKEKQSDEPPTSFQIGSGTRGSPSCKLCVQKVPYGHGRRSLVYRPAMLSMVAVAAVCVCVSIFFKSMPEVICVFQPFRWEMLEYGAS